MTLTAIGAAPEIALSVIVGGLISLARMTIWLIGLVIAIKGSRAEDRAAVLSAYTTLHDPRHVANISQARTKRQREGYRRRAQQDQADPRPCRRRVNAYPVWAGENGPTP